MIKKIFTLLSVMFAMNAIAEENIWSVVQAPAHPAGIQSLYPPENKVYFMNTASLRARMVSLSENVSDARTFSLPMPDGAMRDFKLWQSPVLPATLSAQYPAIRTFTGIAADQSSVTIKVDFTEFGFHAMILDGANTYFIDPYSDKDDGYYLCYYKRDYKKPESKQHVCDVTDNSTAALIGGAITVGNNDPHSGSMMKVHGAVKRNYRLALACTGEYAVAVCGSNTPTKALVLSAMVTSLNRINGVYEKEIGVHMDLIATDTAIIFLDGTTDPYDNNSGPTMQGQNQTTLDSIIGTSNYDIGHVFSTGGGGIAQLESVCRPTTKAKGVTGQSKPVGDAFDIDYVAHEMGHQFGATHSFNSNSGDCAGNGTQLTAYEPGSGSTIMAYAGICTSADNIQQHSDDYFHSASLGQISDFLNNVTGGGLCASSSSSGNIPATLPSFSQTYHIPYLTPFELIAPQATDADHDVLTYCWEENDLGDFGQVFANVHNGPIFRSFLPDTSRTRIFPELTKLRQNVTNYVGEKLPDVARTMNFALTVRDVYNGWGTFNTPSDMITLDVINTGIPFAVTQPNTASAYWQIGSTVNVNWDVANTTQAPISCSNVDIFLSLDDGITYPYVLASNTPNDGSESITVPAGSYTASARVKVKGAGNVFFDISNQGFIINDWPSGVPQLTWTKDVLVYPVPASNVLHVRVVTDTPFSMHVTNAVGQDIWSGKGVTETSVNIANWTSGVYLINIVDENTGEHVVKRFVKE